MLKVGFKTGPHTWEEGKVIAREDGVKLCEIWFRIDKAEEYTTMLTWFAKEHVRMGLHHWGLIDGQYKTNIAAADDNIRLKSIAQIKDTIDVGESINCAYVNAHCGACASETISFDPWRQALIAGSAVSKEKAAHLFLQSAAELRDYAKQKGVLLTIETLPGLESIDERLATYDPGNIHHEIILEAGNQGSFIANDITHTATRLFREEHDLGVVWQRLLDFTKRALPYTRLFHINTVDPPFIGPDSHTGFLPEDFARGVFPNERQLKEFLQMASTQDDIFVIPEPHSRMRENTQALLQLCYTM